MILNNIQEVSAVDWTPWNGNLDDIVNFKPYNSKNT